ARPPPSTARSYAGAKRQLLGCRMGWYQLLQQLTLLFSVIVFHGCSLRSLWPTARESVLQARHARTIRLGPATKGKHPSRQTADAPMVADIRSETRPASDR